MGPDIFKYSPKNYLVFFFMRPYNDLLAGTDGIL